MRGALNRAQSVGRRRTRRDGLGNEPVPVAPVQTPKKKEPDRAGRGRVLGPRRSDYRFVCFNPRSEERGNAIVQIVCTVAQMSSRVVRWFAGTLALFDQQPCHVRRALGDQQEGPLLTLWTFSFKVQAMDGAQ